MEGLQIKHHKPTISSKTYLFLQSFQIGRNEQKRSLHYIWNNTAVKCVR